MAGEVLLPRVCEQIAALPVAAVGAHRASRHLLRQLAPRFSVIERDEQPRPGLRPNLPDELHRRERKIDPVAFGSGRQTVRHGCDLRCEFLQQNLHQRIAARGHPDLVPPTPGANHPVTRLGIEELVGEDDRR